MIYRVKIMPVAQAAIDRYIAYIAVDQQSPEVAARVLSRIQASLAKLETFPHAGGRAPEDARRDYLIRFRRIDQCLALYNVDDRSRNVRVIGFRHGAQLPQLEDLPESLDG